MRAVFPSATLVMRAAKELVSEDGFFGVKQTSDRVANFVFSLAGDNVDLLKEAREGIVRGFEEAEKMWGGKLPDISYQTQDRTLDLIDQRIAELENPVESSGEESAAQ